MSRPSRPLDGAAATARAELPEADQPAFDQLANAMLGSSTAPLGAVLRGRLPGTAGVQWLRREGLAPTARAADLTAAQWTSLYRRWAESRPHRNGGSGARAAAGRTSADGHAPGAKGVPRWF
jgi:hypothetical protein